MEEKYINLEGLTRYDQLLKSKIGVEAGAGHEYVEIAGIKWATMNIGANSITDTGLYFAWAETTGYTADQVTGSSLPHKDFQESDNVYYSDGSYTKYNSGDGLVTLQSGDDAVTAAWGGNWRMPTVAEFQALGNAVNTTWTASYQGSGVSGLVLTDKTDSSKVLFFPAAGYCDGGSVGNVGRYGGYWSSSLYADGGELSAYYMDFNSRNVDWDSYYRYGGYSVRGVYTGDKPSGTVGKVLGTTILDSERESWNAKVNASDVYNKTEIDNMIGDIESLLSNI